MSGASQDIINNIQAKLSSGEIVKNILLNVSLPEETLIKEDKIFALVECKSSYALFIFTSESRIPSKFSDLTIDRTVPIDEYFTCDTDPIPNSDTRMIYNVIYRTIKMPFYIEIGHDSSTFASEIIKAKEVYSVKVPDHRWLEKYGFELDTYDHDFIEQASNACISRQKLARGQTSTSSRDSMFRFEMESRKAQYTLNRECSIFVGTWNVNGQPPPDTLRSWLSCDPQPPVLYAVGFQELDLSKEAFLFNDTPREAEWEKAVSSSTHPGAKYRNVALIRLVGIQLIVLIHNDHYGHVRDVAWDTVGTGILGKMGNKGGVAVRLRLYDTTLCFVCCHLAAHQDEMERRNQDYRDINDRINFRKPPQTIREHDQIYWLGDMNYRVSKLSVEQVKKFILLKQFKDILKYDQLGVEQSQGKVLECFTEGDINFQPTYKFDLHTDKYDSSEKARTPAWTDRILFRGKGIHQLSYRSHMELRHSDHKPVSALFKSEIAVIDESRYKKIQEEVFKLMDKLENEILPQVTVDQTEVLFGLVKFREVVTREIIVANTGQVPVEFKFVNKLDEDCYCQDWLRITPNCGNIEPGEKCDIRLEVNLEQPLQKLSDILVLHLENGKDIFITVSGECKRSCFTTSISVLCRAPVPILHMTPEQLRLAENQHSPVLYSIPRELWLMIDYLYRNGLKTRELFESRALHDDIIKVRDWLDNGSLNPIPDNVSAVAEALVLFLSYTKDPVIPHYLSEKTTLNSNNYFSCQQVIFQLPDLHRNVFIYVCMFLKELLKHFNENGTDAKMLASLFGDILLRSPPGRAKVTQINRGKLTFVHHFLVNDISSLVIPNK